MNQVTDSGKKNLEAIVTQSTKAGHGVLLSHTLDVLGVRAREQKESARPS
jgi:hypothetical protein